MEAVIIDPHWNLEQNGECETCSFLCVIIDPHWNLETAFAWFSGHTATL